MFEHVSVLMDETIAGLNIRKDGIYVDGTLGAGGHSKEIVKQLTTGKLICFDQDLEALESAKAHLKAYEDQIIFIHANFRNMEKELLMRNIREVDGFLFDLGVSSPQLDHGERGFSYHQDAILDMRMDQSQSLTAYEVVNDWSYGELVRIFFSYGEEKFSKQIARAIEKRRLIQPIKTTEQLVDVIKEAMPQFAKRTGGHPAKRIFQAIRIAVNDELNAFYDVLHQAAKLTSIGGRIAVITFHSLEDRICKQAFKKWSETEPLPRNMPVVPDEKKPPFKRVTKKPIVASDDELTKNRRSRSAKLRVVEKTRAWDAQFFYKKGREL